MHAIAVNHCPENFPKALLELAVPFGKSTGPALGFRSTHKLLGTFPFSAKPIATVAHREAQVRQAHSLRTEGREKLLSLSSGENHTVFRIMPTKLSQSAFWKLSTPFWPRDIPFLAEAVGKSFTKLTASLRHFCSNVLPQEKSLYLRLRPLNILQDDTDAKALLTALWNCSIVSAGLLESAGRKTEMQKIPLAQIVQGKEKKKARAAIR